MRQAFLWLWFPLALAFCSAPQGVCVTHDDCGPGQVCEASICVEKAVESGVGTQLPSTTPTLPADAGAHPDEPCAGQPDSPDDGFSDTNCDGVDGDASKSVFVSMNGNDTAPGSLAAPVKSLDAAVGLAFSSQKTAILLARGTYATPARWKSGLSLYGGYDERFVRSDDPQNRAVLEAPASGWKVSDLNQPVLFERVKISSANAQTPGSASVALRVVNGSVPLVLRKVRLSAGHGAPGVDGAAGPNGTVGARGGNGAASEQNKPDACPAGGAPASSPFDQGGTGGEGGCNRHGDGHRGTESVWGSNILASGGAGGRQACDPPSDGQVGGKGPAGTLGADGANGIGRGSVDATEGLWKADPGMWGAAGQVGTAGRSGGGGGGGGKLDCGVFGPWQAGGGGGGGGGPGTGGGGGKGGSPGGASIAVVVSNATVTVLESVVQVGSGGRAGGGGPGGIGGDGGRGGFGGADSTQGNVRSGAGGQGGAGGAGGNGGKGGHGSGGPVVGFWCAHGGEARWPKEVSFELGSVGWPTNHDAAQHIGCVPD